MKTIEASIVAALVAATACAAPPAASSARDARGTPAAASLAAEVPTGTLRPLPPGVTVFYNASSSLTSQRLGGLVIRVKREVRPDGTSVTKVTYERSKPCHEEAGPGGDYFVACPVAWRKTQRLAREEQFTIDPALMSAALTDTLQGKRVTIRWTAVGAPLPPRVNENGNLFSDMRQATASGAWGDWTHNHPPEGGPGVLLSRRVPSP